jgi:ABC-type phosphate transport system substrate-binding protein
MRARWGLSLVLLVTLTALCASVFAQQRPAPPPPAYLVIVNPRNAVTDVERRFVEDAFLKKITSWPNDEVIRPADLATDSPVRRAFTREILNRSVEAVKVYWQQRIFSGRDVPPPEFSRDEEVVQFVQKHAGGIGYVSGTASIGDCKVVAVR